MYLLVSLVLAASLTAGVVQVKVLSMSGQVVSDTVLFTYTERKDKYNEERRRIRRNYLDGEITSSEDGLEYLSLVLEKIKEIDLNSKEGTSCNGEQVYVLLSIFNVIECHCLLVLCFSGRHGPRFIVSPLTTPF